MDVLWSVLLVHLRSVGWDSAYRSGAFVAGLDPFSEKRDLATWRAVPAKVCHSVVRLTPRADTILPNQQFLKTQENHRPSISICVLYNHWIRTYDFLDMED